VSDSLVFHASRFSKVADKDKLRAKVDRKINELQSAIEEYREYLYEEGNQQEWSEFEDLQWELASSIYKSTHELRDRDFYQRLHQLYHKCEFEHFSYESIKLGYHILRYLDNEFRLTQSFQLQDYSSGIICLSKAFENEINHSIVQWIRKQHGIKLPEYYYKYDDQRGDLWVNSGTKKVNVNRHWENKWVPPGLGESKWLANDLNRPESFDGVSWNFFCQKWGQIIPIRNKTAHPHSIDAQASLDMMRILEDLSSKRYFHRMIQLKRSLREE
jgi:hypothetical protein